jgi:hypothetical protein
MEQNPNEVALNIIKDTIQIIQNNTEYIENKHFELLDACGWEQDQIT